MQTQGHKKGYRSSAESKRKPTDKHYPRNRKMKSISLVKHVDISKKRKFAEVNLNGVNVKLQLDYAADITIISTETWACIGKPTINPTDIVAVSASGDKLDLKGEFITELTTRNVSKQGCIYVANHSDLDVLVKFPEVFQSSLGLCTKAQVTLYLKSDFRPVYCPKRPVAYAALPKCSSPIGLPPSSWSDRHPLPGARIFPQIDLSADAYLQVEVEEESRKLLTVNTHRGLFQYNRLAPGIKSAPGAFQRIIDCMVAGIPGVKTYLDDILVSRRTQEEHDRNLNATLGRIHKISWSHHRKGRSPPRSSQNSCDLCDAGPQGCVTASILSWRYKLLWFVGQIKELRAPLDRLLKKDARWEWTPECQSSFDRFKSILQSDLLLTHFDPRKEIIVAGDASKHGLGAVIMHRFPNGSIKPIAYASRSLTQAPAEGFRQQERDSGVHSKSTPMLGVDFVASQLRHPVRTNRKLWTCRSSLSSDGFPQEIGRRICHRSNTDGDRRENYFRRVHLQPAGYIGHDLQTISRGSITSRSIQLYPERVARICENNRRSNSTTVQT
ncbi:uncharacterized protein LOC129743217 [Uranotaenia lowii]|uniref:uncharacterized protein LOC129743217 n=1 Tax=Uranotaenia lowii TaxID=190385 RepID=UPI00247AB522|nr:uncharacterized protein LOC129743217 [Uranotaenia lowii]